MVLFNVALAQGPLQLVSMPHFDFGQALAMSFPPTPRAVRSLLTKADDADADADVDAVVDVQFY